MMLYIAIEVGSFSELCNTTEGQRKASQLLLNSVQAHTA